MKDCEKELEKKIWKQWENISGYTAYKIEQEVKDELGLNVFPQPVTKPSKLGIIRDGVYA